MVQAARSASRTDNLSSSSSDLTRHTRRELSVCPVAIALLAVYLAGRFDTPVDMRN